jgi:hypothetical protein
LHCIHFKFYGTNFFSICRGKGGGKAYEYDCALSSVCYVSIVFLQYSWGEKSMKQGHIKTEEMKVTDQSTELTKVATASN